MKKAVDFSILKKLKDQPSAIENYVQKPIKVAVDEKGNKLVVLTIKMILIGKNLKLRANV